MPDPAGVEPVTARSSVGRAHPTEPQRPSVCVCLLLSMVIPFRFYFSVDSQISSRTPMRTEQLYTAGTVSVLQLKAPITTAADDILKYISLHFKKQKQKRWGYCERLRLSVRPSRYLLPSSLYVYFFHRNFSFLYCCDLEN